MYFSDEPESDAACALPGGPMEIDTDELPPEDCPLRAGPVTVELKVIT